MAIFTHQFQLLFRECDYPNAFMVWIGLHGVMFLFLFGDFYKSKYSSIKGKSKQLLANGTTLLNGGGASKNGGNAGACMVSDEWRRGKKI